VLILTRTQGEVIYIQDNDTGEVITLLVSKIQRNTVALGLEGNKERYTFLRKEVLERQQDHPNPSSYYEGNGKVA